jgi:hypothetical protein
MIYIASYAPVYEAIYIIVLVYLTEISTGACEAIYIIVLVYLTEISTGADEAIYIIVLELHMLYLISQLATPVQ